MKRPWYKTPHRLTRSVATVLSVAFVSLIAGPVFLYAGDIYNPPTAATEGDFSDQTGLIDNTTFQDTTFWGQPVNPDVPDAFSGENLNDINNAQTKANENAKKAADKLAEKQATDELAAAFSCWSWTGGINFKGCVAAMMDMVMWVAARTLWIAGVLFNITIDYTLNLNTLLTQLPIVDVGWKILRDLANVVFIFIALWAGISITLGIGDEGKKAWGLLAEMVLVALFINFSLFITKAVVDVSNVAALHFYSLIVPAEGAKKYDSGLAEAYLYGLKLGTLYNSKQIGSGEINGDASTIATVNRSSGNNLSFTNIILIGFFGSLFIIVTAWVFFAGAIMFIYRAITLMMLMMLSPLAFVGLILPGASGMAHEWWHKLWSQAFFAPLYLILAYIVVSVINTPAFSGGLANAGAGGGFASALTGTGSGTVVVIFNFVMLIGLMVACLIVAQSLGAKGSEMAMAGFEKIKGGALGFAGAGVRGVIKAPSAIVQGGGNIGKGISWMANTRLLNNKYLGNFKDTRLGKGINAAGTKVQEKTGAVRSIGKLLDPRYLEERIGQTKLGNYAATRALRSMTTGALANVKIGEKSLEEAYEESEHDASKRQVIGFISQAREAGTVLKPLREKEHHHQEEAFSAEEEVKKREQALAQAKNTPPPLTNDQQANVATKEQELETAKKISPDEASAIAKIEVFIADDEANLKEAQAQFDGTGGTGEESEKLAKKIDTIEKALKANQEKVGALKNPHRIAEAEKALAEAKKPPLTDGQKETQKNDIQAKKDALKVATDNLNAATKALKEFADKNGPEMAKQVRKISEAYSKISAKEYAEDTPKDDFLKEELIDYAYLPSSHAIAARDDEHALTESEKEEFFHKRMHRTSSVAKRGEKRNEWFNNDYLKFQMAMNRQTEVLKQIMQRQNIDIEQERADAEKLRKTLEELKKKL